MLALSFSQREEKLFFCSLEKPLFIHWRNYSPMIKDSTHKLLLHTQDNYKFQHS